MEVDGKTKTRMIESEEKTKECILSLCEFFVYLFLNMTLGQAPGGPGPQKGLNGR